MTAQRPQPSRDQAYRPDLDGLRAVAVLLVVLNHAGLALLSGGFIGVDIFFVISGFLITGMIRNQQAQGRFRFTSFYLRRSKRLLPALFLVIGVVLLAGYAVLIPSDYTLTAQSGLSAIGLASNLFFASQTGGYFSPDAQAFPLLHLWSLSVEEQFYLLWPASLLLIQRLPNRAGQITPIAILAAASFAYAQWGVSHHQVSAYFLLPARAGEFLIGALTLLLWQSGRPASPALANSLSGIGIALVIGAALSLNARSPFPGLAALIPALGAALIIAAPQFGVSLVSRLLATRPLISIGLISYSVYLWHWPLVSYLHLFRITITPLVTLALVATSLTLGYLSWRFVEKGYRTRLERHEPPALIGAAAATLALVLGAAFITQRDGLPQRFPYALLTQDQLTAERGRYWRALPAKHAKLADGTPVPQALIIGNSHAFDLAYALQENGYPGNIRLIETFHECFNFGHDAMTPTDTPLCATRLRAVLTSPDLKVADVVFLHDNWGRFDAAGLTQMITAIRRVTAAPIYVVGPKMTFTDDVLAISKLAQQNRYATIAGINHFAARFQDADKVTRDQQLNAYFQTQHFAATRYIDMLQIQCGPARQCDILSPTGQYLYFDAGHFTLEGSRRFGEKLKTVHPEAFGKLAPISLPP